MKQLTMGEILDFAVALEKAGISKKEITQMPVYIGDDDELNGIHCAWDVGYIDTDDTSGNIDYLLEMINNRSGNYPLEKGKAIFIG